ncbi:isoprenylcysteine carboxylmethyltransferase family protein [Maribellus sp. CM-23]|uniref:methyltransferase family protein n=1 Tax=Maribellus sp. CM-23 TaxID=2781026 RepID=UPI001F4420F1|nr:isoprenylcysteine carboxylmethyltransferase family protein [Maribellus sp. CM-23]MCE4564058.1 isoprenylcysteine carboxylmethyltransferase family protein [Maribellus sp. CM-23]
MEFLNYFPLIGFLLMMAFVAARVYILTQKQIRVMAAANPKKPLQILRYLIFTFLFLLWFLELCQPVFSFSILPELLTRILISGAVLKTAGAMLITLALVLWVLTLVHFKTSLRLGLDVTNRGKLITTGIFSVSRNPFFLSLDLYFFGVALVFPNVFMIAFTLAALVGIHFSILKEERFLLQNYGEEYQNYQQKTGRYF